MAQGRIGHHMRIMTVLAVGVMGAAASVQAEERLYSCDTSLMGEQVQINYTRDESFQENVGTIERRFSAWGRVTCPGYVTLREILRRNQVKDDGSYCLLWDRKSNTYVGAQLGARKGNALCRVTMCERVNTAKAATFQGTNRVAIAGYEAVTQRPGAALLAATSGQMAGTLEGAAAVAMGIGSSPVAAGALLVGAAATGGALWYCADEGVE